MGVSCVIGLLLGFPGGSAGKESTWNVGDLGSTTGLGRSPGEGKGYSFRYSGLETSMDCIVYGVSKSWIWLSDFHFHMLLDFHFHVGSDGKESAYNAGDEGFNPWVRSGRSLGEGNDNPLQYSCLDNPMDRGAWQATVCGDAGVGNNWATSTHTHTHTLDFHQYLFMDA